MRSLVVHDSPGRLRLRVPAGVSAEGLVPAVSATPGVTRCTWSALTRSLLVLYDSGQTDRSAIAGAVVRATGVVDAALVGGAPDAPARPVVGAALGEGVREMFGELDQRVSRVTRGLVGLGGLFPVALAAWALAEVVRGRTAPLAWSSALWYAHGLFRDYQVPAARD